LFLVQQGDQPLAPSARFCLSGIETVVLNRGMTSSFERRESERTLSIDLADSWVSARHARLKQVFGRWIAEDLGSRNGTFLNCAPLTSAHLSDGDLLEMGHTCIIFRSSLRDSAEPSAINSAQFDAPVGMRTLLPHLSHQFSTLTQIAKSNVSVIVQGETGTGKELVARAVHELSQRTGPFVAVNCNAIPATLLESELFGYRRGSFSGAIETRTGLIRAADKGTLFLDEIGDLPTSSQGSLLRVLQERQVLPLGEVRPVPLDIRVCVASHRDLQQMVASKELREDLYARLAGFTIQLPPLRERREDLGLLVSSILHRIVPAEQLERVALHQAAERALFRYHWPFNIRELERCLEAALVLAQNGLIRLQHLPAPVQAALAGGAPAEVEQEASAEDTRLRDELTHQLTENGGNVAAVARALGKEPMQIRRWIKRFRLDLSKFRA
jgi:transcriptional regulator with GAF, ATPase, and Fis domain